MNTVKLNSVQKYIISIIVPTYNRATIIPKAIDSIRRQTFQEWECLVVDDFSSDDTEAVINQYHSQDKRIKFLRNNRKKGAQGARNTGILASSGEWVVLFDSDNVMHPDFLQKCADAIDTNNIDVVTTWSNVIDSNTNTIIRYFKWVNNGIIYKGILSAQCYVDNSSTLIRKSKLEEIGLLSEDCPAFQEWDTHIRLSKIATYKTIEECLIDYYAGASDAISSDPIKDVKGYVYILSKFRKEWLDFSKYRYIKYVSLLGYKISLLSADKRAMFKESYKTIVGGYKPIIWLLSKMVAMKRNAI